MGNIWSVSSALDFLSVKSRVTSEPEEISSSDCIILPGVGSFREAMMEIREKKIDQALEISVSKGTKILGICLGMQLLGASSTEDDFTEGLNFFTRKVDLFSRKDEQDLKIPHIGFNAVKQSNNSRLYKGLDDKSDFYLCIHIGC